MEKNTIINKLTKKPLDIEDFVYIIPWQSIRRVMYAKDYKRFVEWMKGQTIPQGGVFVDDLYWFLLGKDSFRD